MNEIRVQYSGFVIFVAKLLSIATGLAFQLMIARSVLPRDYGVWFNVSDITAYFTLLAGVFPFWALRFTARAKPGAIKTAFVANSATALIASTIYLVLTPTITSSLGISAEYFPLYVLAVAQIAEVYLLNALESCLQAKKPHTLGYGLLIEETVKIAAGYLLIVWFRLSLIGALVSIIVGVAFQLAFYSKLLASELADKVEWTYVKEWIKGSVANIYNIVGGQIASFILIMLFLYGGEAARGYYGAAAQIAILITYASYLAYALYPKLLASGQSRDVTTSLRTVLMFAIPMAAGAIALPDSYLGMLKTEYRAAWPILILLTLDALTLTVNATFSYVLYGLEKLDEEAKISFKELFKSRLFKAFTLPYLHAAIALPIAYYALTRYAGNDPVTSALSVALINGAVRFAMFILLYLIIRGMARIEIPWRNIAKYVVASAVMAAILYVLPHPTRVYQILAVTALGGALYLSILSIIDGEARNLIKSAWREAVKLFKI